MTYDQFLTRIIDDGIIAATEDYKNNGPQLNGSIRGFEACRGKTPAQLADLLVEANTAASAAIKQRPNTNDLSAYQEARHFAAEVEWVVNCVSAVLINEGQAPLTSYHPTVRAVKKVAEIIGVASLQ